MIYGMGGLPYVPPLELDGVRYQQADSFFDPALPGATGYLEAIDIQTETRLWAKQIYYNEPATDPEFATTAHKACFLRMKFWPGTRDILIENTSRGKFFINIDTQQVRKATAADFPPPLKRPPPPEVPPIEFNGMRYKQIMNGLEEARGARCGFLEGIDLKTGKSMWLERIYVVPFNAEIEDDQQECYFTRMVLLPGQQDILIENEAGEKYLFNLKRSDVRPLGIPEIDYVPAKVSMGERIKDAVQAFIRRIKK